MDTGMGMKKATTAEVREVISEIDPSILLADNYDAALIGYVELWAPASEGASPTAVALYDREACLQILMNEGLTEEEAREHLSFNTMGAYVGPYTPAFATILRTPLVTKPLSETQAISLT
jgi:hypothetical protein